MDLFQTIVLSVIEGITEFLPISSTGHQILAAQLLNLSETDFVKSFEIIIQLGAILSIIILYYKTFLTNRKVLLRVFLAFIPTGIIGLTVYKLVKDYLLGNSPITVWALFLGGIILIVFEIFYKEKDHHKEKIEDLSYWQSFVIGIFQSLSIIPGVSRSAATIVGSMLMGTKRKAAVEFSFLLAVPTMIAASGLDLVKSHSHFSGSQLLTLFIGFTISFFVALIVVRFLLQYIQKNTFIPFGIYRIALAIVFWLLILNR